MSQAQEFSTIDRLAKTNFENYQQSIANKYSAYIERAKKPIVMSKLTIP
jgi:hypothetical protein